MTRRTGPRRTRQLLTIAFAGAAISALILPVGHATGSHGQPELPANRPNVLLLVSDDQTWGSFTRTLMPNVFDQLVDGGVSFQRAYVNAALCCPSRAEIMTGLYEHHTGVDLNNVSLTQPTIIEALHDLGYRTMLAGKYLNSYPCDPPLPEYDEWVCQGAGDSGYSLVNPSLNVDGQWLDVQGYTTDILADYVNDFIAGTPVDQPFFAMYTPTSPHLPADDPRCKDIAVDPNRPPNWNEDTIGDGKPDYVKRSPLTSDEITSLDADHKAMTQAVPCLDGSIGMILDSLGNRAQETLVVYLSDHGYLTGEHRWDGKMAPYEEAMHIPFVIRYPALLPEAEAFTSDAIVQNIDIAPTIADLLGIHWGADGTSLAPLLTGAASVRDAGLIEHCQGVSFPCWGYQLTPGNRVIPTSFFGVVTDRFKYLEYVTGEKELYDLFADPSELTNLDGDPGHAAEEASLAGTLAELTAPPPTDTTIVTGPQGPLGARSLSFGYFSQSLDATYECRLDKDGTPGPWILCNGGTAIVGSLADGSYTFRVRGTQGGDVDQTPDSRSFSVASTGPQVSITSGPAPHLKDTSVSFSFSSTTPGVTFQCGVASFGEPQAWRACDPSHGAAYGPLSDGVWSFEVKAVDVDGTESLPPAEWLFDIDNAGPTVTFTGAPKPITNETSAVFSFFPDESLIGTITCKLASKPSADCSSGTFTASALTEGSHTLSVRATDELGNTGTTSYTWTIDLTPPVASITSGPPAYWDDAAATFTFSSSEPQDALFQCRVDSSVWVDCPSRTSVTDLLDGPHAFSVMTIDEGVNFSSPATWVWTQDTVTPTATITSGPKSITRSGSATFTFTSSETGSFDCALDAGAAESCASPSTYTGLKDGAHTFDLTVTDLAGNESGAVTFTWTIDTVKPVLTITSGPNNPTTETSATFVFSADELGTKYKCSLDAGRAIKCTSPKTYAGLAKGSHVFSVYGTDPAGNVSATATWSWTIN